MHARLKITGHEGIMLPLNESCPQTGTGKTYSMDGGGPGEQAGIVPRTFEHIFDSVDSSSGMKWMVRASFLEIYNEEVRMPACSWGARRDIVGRAAGAVC